MMAPCKDCPDRTVEPNCHTDCEKYRAFQQFIDSHQDEKFTNGGLNEYAHRQIERQRRHAVTHTWKHYRSRMN